LVVEDLQWIDTATQGLLSRLVETERDLALLVIATARTGYQPPWSGSPNTNDLVLPSLSASGTEALLRGRLGSQDLPDTLIQLVMEKSQGNPLFAEEVASYLRDNGAITGDGDGLAFAADGDVAALPVAIENLLMNRFDKLERGPRAVLETAAVTSTGFTAKLMQRAIGLGEEIGAHLETLVQQDLIRPEQGGRAYVFRHTLTRDAIYDSLLSARRQALHQAVAKAIEAQDNFQPDDAADALAYHWSRSTEPGRAVQYLAIAGENSLRIYSLEEAQNHLQQALDIIEANPGCVDDTVLADILLHIARALYFQFDFQALIALVEPYLERVEALGDTRRLSRFLFETGYAHVFGCQAEKGRALLDRARALAEADGDELAVAYADMGIMWHRCYWGKTGEARHHAQREAAASIVEIGKRRSDTWLASKGQLANSIDLVAWGHPGAARASLMKLMAMSRDTNDPRPRTMAQWALEVVDIFAGDYDEAIEKADDALRICLSPIDRCAAQGFKGLALLLSGQVETGMTQTSKIIDETDAKSFLMVTVAVKMALGIGRVLQGDMANGVRALEAVQAQAEAWNMTTATPMGNFYLGRTYLQFAISDEKPPLSVMLANLPFLLRTLPFAKSKARQYLQNALDGFRALDVSADIAQCHYHLGLLDQATKRIEQAKKNFNTAREVAASVEADNIVRDADAALAELNAA
jgi:tetratricopeptide (TPR) repeat protein